MPKRLKSVLIGAAVIALVVLYLSGVRVQYALNNDTDVTDQGAYMDYAKKLYGSDYTWVGDRNRMPLYPLLTSLVYAEEMDRDVFFARGKALNIALSLLILAALYPLLRRHLPLHPTLNLMLIFAFSVFIFRAAYFQCELLFYFFNLLAFWQLSRLLVRPRGWLGLTAGVTLGLAHLTKASVLPGLALFGACAALQALERLWRARRRMPEVGHSAQRWAVGLATALLVVLTFLATVFPYIRHSKQMYGHYFYNVNSTFYIWYDSWSEVKQGTRQYGDREGWPDMPADQIPSLPKYVREHTPAQMLQRLWRGAQVVVVSSASSYGYFAYAVLYVLLALGCLMATWRSSRSLACQNRCLLLFWVSWFVLYFALYAWYVPITRGERLPLAQFMPLMWVLSLVFARLGAQIPSLRLGRRRISFTRLVNTCITCLLAADIYLIVTDRIATMTGAS